MSATPYVSFVTYGRNDGYTPSYMRRVSRAASCLAFQVLVATAFQRYIEPLVLLSLTLVVARSVTADRARMAVLATVFGAYDLLGLARLYNAFVPPG